MNGNVGEHKLNNDEWIAVFALFRQYYGRKNRKNVYLLLHHAFFAGWEHRHRSNCLQDQKHEKTHQLFNREHGHLGSAAPGFLYPYVDSIALHQGQLLADWWSSWPRHM